MQVILADKELMTKTMRRPLKINDITVDPKWITTLETAGNAFTKAYMEAALELLRMQKKQNPLLFLNKSALMVGESFLNAIDEIYVIFADDKDGFQFGTEFTSHGIETNIRIIYTPLRIKYKCWIALIFHLVKRNITILNCATSKISKEQLNTYIGAYAHPIPYIIRQITQDDMMVISPFSIQIESKEVPQVAKIADTCVFLLKLIKSHSMRIKDLTKLSEENIGDIRFKLAADLFSELLAPDRRWRKDAQRRGEETFPFLFSNH
ncbi:unnamed protein product [Thlaspi arvense]|uniref:Ubiquitin-like protease family profile domain-containing protein n=1 Tax=Thlaspi arvense TaxID=13288 RepID=A0AAU9T5X3_THLAR|nr:unnamed protein product [Thlaspi arvense]